MGYRNYIRSISKDKYDSIKDLNKEELFEYYKEELIKENGPEDWKYISPTEIVETELYELGKYVEIFDNNLFTDVFSNKELKNYFLEDHDFFIVNKIFMKTLIDRYSEKVRSYYKDMTNGFFTEGGVGPIPKKEGLLNSIKMTYDDNMGPKYNFDLSKITQEEQNSLFKIIEHVKSMSREWGVGSTYYDDSRPYNLEEGEAISSSWKYEYAQFELVRIYKSFNWENNKMIYYGH